MLHCRTITDWLPHAALHRKACEQDKPRAEENRCLREQVAAARQACLAAEAQLREAEGGLRGLREGAAREAARAQALERQLQVRGLLARAAGKGVACSAGRSVLCWQGCCYQCSACKHS